MIVMPSWLLTSSKLLRLPRQRLGPRPIRPTDRELAASPWLVFTPPATVELRHPTVRQLRRLAPGTTVCLVVDQPLARLRLRRLARRAGVTVRRELVVVASTASPLMLVDDHESAVAHFWNAVATVRPGMARTALPASLLLRLARRAPWTWTGALAPGRVLIGTTS